MSAPTAALRFASFLGDNAFGFNGQVVAYLGMATGLPTCLVSPPPDPTGRYELGALDGAFCCGLPYVRQADRPSPPVRLLAAPVMAAKRYADRPVYFSDVIVRAGSDFQTLADLRGATFAYNQTTSFSGYVLAQYHLLTLGETFDFFGSRVATGSHAGSMDAVEAGGADCAAIDSVVLETELRQRPERAAAWRVVASLGPAAMPPAIASTRLDPETHAGLRQALVEMHTTSEGAAILRQSGMQRFAAVTDADYDDIRRRLRALEAV